jgi:tetratricopeptide (TPR) repeat protein
MRNIKRSVLIAFMVIMINLPLVYSQELLILPDASPAAMVMQEVGISHVKISYHSPAVNGREVWGKLVPYGWEAPSAYGNGKPTPWRAGANENTTITFSHDAMVEGQPIPAGTYGLFMVAQPDQWTIIFSKNSTSWGHFFYEESEDALRVNVKPLPVSESQDRLSYGFDNTNTTKTIAYMRWEKIKVPFTIAFDTPAIVVENLKKQLRNRNAFNGQALVRAANYCLQNNIALDQALAWADRALAYNGGAQALFTKAAVLEKQGKGAEAESMRKAATENASEAELNTYGYNLIARNKVKDAIDIFKLNVKKHPDSWNVYDSLAEALAQSGDKKGSVENYTKALKLVKDEANKKRIEEVLKKIQK